MRTLFFQDRFDAAHRLRGYAGQCRHLHGHGYEVSVQISTPEMADDKFIIDYDEIKKVLKQMDHATLVWQEDESLRVFLEAEESKVCVLPEQSTTENISRFIAENIAEALQVSVATIEVHVRETPKGGCYYRHEKVLD